MQCSVGAQGTCGSVQRQYLWSYRCCWHLEDGARETVDHLQCTGSPHNGVIGPHVSIGTEIEKSTLELICAVQRTTVTCAVKLMKTKGKEFSTLTAPGVVCDCCTGAHRTDISLIAQSSLGSHCCEVSSYFWFYL
jgi:hypothetical protein